MFNCHDKKNCYWSVSYLFYEFFKLGHLLGHLPVKDLKNQKTVYLFYIWLSPSPVFLNGIFQIIIWTNHPSYQSIFTFSKQAFNESLDFSTTYSLINAMNLIDSCQAHLPMQYTLNIKFICQKWHWCCD